MVDGLIISLEDINEDSQPALLFLDNFQLLELECLLAEDVLEDPVFQLVGLPEEGELQVACVVLGQCA